MSEQNHTITSGNITFQKLTKTGVKKIIKETGTFKGFCCGNNTNPAHLIDMWSLGIPLTVDSVEEFDVRVNKITTDLRNYTPELGSYLHYYQNVEDIADSTNSEVN